jgi:hypothetical protein
MKRVLLVLAVALLMVAMVVASAAPVFAGSSGKDRGESKCNHQKSPLCGGRSLGGNPLPSLAV